MSEKEIVFCKSGGCTAKLGAGGLEHILERLPKGYDSKDDAAVYRLNERQAVVQTLDFFPPMVEDPYIFGKIAATNALSDIYAMGGEVKTALNIVCFPESMDLNILGRILQGGAEKVQEAGGSLAGGHSIADSDIKYGLSVTGVVDPEKIWENNGAKPGDCLILTKRLGVGILCAANRVSQAPEGAMEQVIDSMTTLNRKASEIGRKYPVHACTDVTGFGFLGHLHEMMDGRHSCKIYADRLPVFDGAEACAEEFLLTAAGQKNRNHLEQYVRFENVSGGLLFAVPGEVAEELRGKLREAGLPAEIVGKVMERQEMEILVAGRK